VVLAVVPPVFENSDEVVRASSQTWWRQRS
jgi:hypothetical protein